jgi:hypothetical protein
MTENFNIPRKALYLAWLFIAIGLVAVVYGFFSDSSRLFPVLLLNNFFFLSISLGAVFFIALQHVTDSGWSVMFQRVPEAMASYIPAGFLVMFVFLFGMGEIYEWAQPGVTETDPLIDHKSPYLNVPFFYARLILVFIAWMVIIFLMRRNSVKGDTESGLKWFAKNKHLSRVFIFVFAITFTVASFDWIMSIDSHWFSALFGIRAIISSLYYAVAVIILIVICLKHGGYVKAMNKYHMNDFGRYLFRMSIVFGYLWFMQYLIIWYANIPETTFYYVYRVNEPWTILFYSELVINWTIPFVVLMADDIARRKAILVPVSIMLLAGFYLSLYLQIMPGSYGELNIGFTEIGSFAGFAGVFILFFSRALSRVPLLAESHPYFKESIGHHV